MTDQNPYQPPAAKVAEQVVAPRSLPAGRGVDWLREGYGLFMRAPGIWVVNTILLFVLMILLSMAPFGGILMPLIIGGLMLGCRDLAEGRGELEVAHLFAGFQTRPGPLVGLGAMYLLLSLFITLIVFVGILYVSAVNMQVDPMMIPPGQVIGMLLTMLVAVLLMVPVLMLFWFAPALVILHEELGIFDAMKLSFSGCLRNMLPFTVYGLLLTVLSVLATLPFGLGWLVLTPVIIASIYVSYRDIFIEPALTA